MTNFLRRGGWLWLVAGLGVIVVGLLIARSAMASGFLLALPPSLVAQPVGDLPNMPDKQTPASYTLDGCPPEGKGGDSQLNLLKNRSDPGKYVTVSFDSLTTLTWPKSVERLPMAEWPESGRNFIMQYAGTPITVEGYIVNLREGSPDAANCFWTNGSYLDWHLAFTRNPRDDRAQSVQVDVTPRIRIKHEWSMEMIHSVLIDDHMPVRLSGWLYFDPERPGDLGVTRTTLWEIHPVMQIQVFDKNRWVPLESFSH